MVCATTTAAGRYMEKPLCLASTARPEKAAVVSDKLIRDGTEISTDTITEVKTYKAGSRRWYHLEGKDHRYLQG
jgi:hypothetical protein